MPAFKECSPAIHVPDGDGKETRVSVRSFTCQGLIRFTDEFRKADLPLPSLEGEKLARFLDVSSRAVAAAKEEGGKLDIEAVSEVIFELIATNMPTIVRWLVRFPELLLSALIETTNLAPEQVEELSIGDAIRIARHVLTAIRSDGALGEAARFFGDLLMAGAQATSNPNPPAVPEAA